ILGRVLDRVTSKTKGELEARAAQAKEAKDPVRADLLVTELRIRVQKANERARSMMTEAEEAEDLLARLRGFDNPEVAETCKALDRVTKYEGPLTEGLRRRVSEVYERAKREADRKYVAEVLRSAFTELGYEVGEDFATLFVEGGTVYCHKPTWRDYSVCVRVEPRGQT